MGGTLPCCQWSCQAATSYHPAAGSRRPRSYGYGARSGPQPQSRGAPLDAPSVGLSEVSVEQLEQARRIEPVVSVQNHYNLANRSAEGVVQYAERENLAFIPWYPIATGRLARPGGPLDEMAKEHGISPSQLALAWLLKMSPAMVPIPGTSKVAHVEENTAAALVTLTDTEFEALSRAV